ncbi:spore coat protein [Clostridium formicaceticum]|uniref:Spore coat protein F n=2 Tax=Clostridium formicaceticum TaxID=1497 RepID=A0AAC9WH44_9CLOT|nr:spore coat protein [Clostridium formicaceticum]ARE88528.1 Spore coat protein F precursor [Clostridium formicaceticum]
MNGKEPINEVKRPMNNDYLEVENADGMPGLVDSTIALEFLLSIKSSIRNAAIALTEIENLEARTAVRNLLNDSINLHAEVSEAMIKKGWLHPYDVNEQFKLDKISAQTALKIASLDLFPKDTSRLGTFATPNY